MLFNSIEYLIFLPIVFVLYWFVFKKTRVSQNVIILLASYFFYGWWSVKFLGLLLLSTLLDYTFGFLVDKTVGKSRKFYLWLSILNNVGILFLFKYFNFFIGELSHALAGIGFHFPSPVLQVALPIGISFYTFHGMSYVFDIYRGLRKPVTNFLDYAVFVCFFPLLVAGPIERANHLLPQVQKKRVFSYSQAVAGCRLMLWGMFKKLVIADSLAPIVEASFHNYQQQSALTLLLGAVAFSFQIYGDFSGYSDIAIGTAKLFGFELLSNFRFPYFSRDIAEFWRRWHISLTSWFRDYLYIPIGGSRGGKLKTVRNIFIVFLVSGLWHGASWNFVAWGALHACAFMPLMLLNRNRVHAHDTVAQHRALPTGRELVQMVTTFAFVTLAWIFFRQQHIRDAFGILKRCAYSLIKEPGQLLHPLQAIPEAMKTPALLMIVPFIGMDWHFRRDERRPQLSKTRVRLNWAVYYIILLCILISAFNVKSEQFIYFKF